MPINYDTAWLKGYAAALRDGEAIVHVGPDLSLTIYEKAHYYASNPDKVGTPVPPHRRLGNVIIEPREKK